MRFRRLQKEGKMQRRTLTCISIALLTLVNLAQAQTLSGSKKSMARQNQQAKDYGYTFIKNSQTISEFVDSGYLVTVEPSRVLELHNVSYPYTRPAVNSFLQDLSSQYYAACHEKLTITSLTRPLNEQPANASNSSVHPTGMAVDLRIPSKPSCRSWLEKSLLALEGAQVLDVTRERRPAHYHIAVFTKAYEQSPLSQSSQLYLVRRGDSLWSIASRMGTTVSQLRSANDLSSDMLQPGQKLQVLTVSSGNDVAAVTEVDHRVRRGDNLWRIAKQYGTSINRLMRDNALSSDALDIGQVLHVRMNLSTP